MVNGIGNIFGLLVGLVVLKEAFKITRDVVQTTADQARKPPQQSRINIGLKQNGGPKPLRIGTGVKPVSGIGVKPVSFGKPIKINIQGILDNRRKQQRGLI